MTLTEWMKSRKLRDAAVAALVGVHFATISKLRRGERMPSARLMNKFMQITDGRVRPNDWFARPRK